jgi:hypothetical protein
MGYHFGSAGSLPLLFRLAAASGNIMVSFEPLYSELSVITLSDVPQVVQALLNWARDEEHLPRAVIDWPDDHSGYTPLGHAVKKGLYDMVHFLVSQGVGTILYFSYHSFLL